ncbi:MAG: hypothetical protein KJO64_04660 [Bacteroidia bacterium]|nr:hypothetical protein [Bacteroidia bacterium]
MKKLIIILLMLPFFAFSQDKKEPSLYEVFNMTVKQGQEDAYEAAVKAHNAKFHPEDGMYHARLFYNLNGPSAFKYSWVMGPTNYGAMDNRPAKGAHDDDWAKVTAMVEHTDAPTYWMLDRELSHLVDNDAHVKRIIWMYDVKSGEFETFKELCAKVKKVYVEKRPTEGFVVVFNEIADTKAGMDAAILFPFDKWGWLDRESNFKTHYEEVHGANSFEPFLKSFRSVINGRVDWMREMVE